MKNGQIKIQQMAFMLMAITLFFVLVGMFVLTFFLAQLRESAGILEERNALLLVMKLANSPEFSCGESFGSKINCIDADKVMALKNHINDYSDFWGVSGIEIRKIYPISDGTECNQENYPDCSIIKISNINAGHSNFVSLCRKANMEGKVYDKCEIALLTAGYD
ncbi:MAG: hypothetical protein AABX28_00665 [Nanoarchaeota archaeon]